MLINKAIEDLRQRIVETPQAALQGLDQPERERILSVLSKMLTDGEIDAVEQMILTRLAKPVQDDLRDALQGALQGLIGTGLRMLTAAGM